jgi:hypothetical protein
VVVSSTSESPGYVSVVVPSTDTSDMQSNSSPSVVKSSWLSKARTIGDEQLPWRMTYNSLSIVLLYEVYDTPNLVATWCSSWAHSRPNIRTKFLEYPIRRSAANAMPLTNGPSSRSILLLLTENFVSPIKLHSSLASTART